MNYFPQTFDKRFISKKVSSGFNRNKYKIEYRAVPR